MKKNHVVILGATYKPFLAPNDLDQGLVPINAPGNYKKPEVIQSYIEEAAGKREKILAELWPLKRFQSLMVRFYDGSDLDFNDPLVVSLDDIGPETKVIAELLPIIGKVTEALERDERVVYVGIGVRDILRLLCTFYGDGEHVLLPYQYISDQRRVIDPIGMLDCGEVNKVLNPVYILRANGIDVGYDFRPDGSTLENCRVAGAVYNRLCRHYSSQNLAS